MSTKNWYFLQSVTLMKNILKERIYKDEQRFQNVEELPGTSLIPAFNSLADNYDHGGKEFLERFL